MILPILVVMANILGAGMIVPQAVKLHRHRVTAGLSGLWIGVGVSLNLWWLAYGISQGLWGLIPLSLASVALYSVVAWLYLSILGSGAARPLMNGLAWFVWPLFGLFVAGWYGVGLALGVAYCVQFSPALRSAFQSSDLSGLSMGTWLMAGAEGAIWFAYGLSVGDTALTMGGAGGAIMSALILARAGWLHGNRDTGLATEATQRQGSDLVALQRSDGGQLLRPR